MKKSSRLWWLHGAILLAAAVGCKSANSNSSYGAPPTAQSGPYGSASGMSYSQNAQPGLGSIAAAQGMQGASNAFPSAAPTGMAAPNMASSMSPLSPNMSGMSSTGGFR